jgi:hypothetical protein
MKEITEIICNTGEWHGLIKKIWTQLELVRVISYESVRIAKDLRLLGCVLIIACNIAVQCHINLNCESS